jgi:predicted enzyme related to lactoylglutathione lyase
MTTGRSPLLRAVDCITVPVSDLDSGLAFYRTGLGHPLLWRNDEAGQAGVALAEGQTELVLTTRQGYAAGWLVDSAEQAAETIRSAGGRVLSEALDTPVGRIAVTADPLGNVLVLLDLSKGHYLTDANGIVIGTIAAPSTAEHPE